MAIFPERTTTTTAAAAEVAKMHRNANRLFQLRDVLRSEKLQVLSGYSAAGLKLILPWQLCALLACSFTAVCRF